MSPRNTRHAALVAAMVAGAIGCSSEEKSEIALRYAGQTVPLSVIEEEFARRGPADFTPETRDSVLLDFASGLLDKYVMAHEATHYPRGDTTGMTQAIAHRRDQLIIQIYMEDELSKVDLSPAKMDQIYEWLGEEVRASSVMLATREEAESVHAEIEGGLAFGEAVETYSIDAFSKANGGDLGWFGYGTLAGIDEAAFPLEVGEVSGPTWTQRGWHILKVEGRRPRERTTVEQDPRLFHRHYGEKLGRQRWAQFLDGFWSKLDVRWNQEGYETALALQTDYRDRYLAKMRDAKRIQAEGKPLGEDFLNFPRGPEPTDEQAALVVATVGEVQYRVGDAASDIWETALSDRPDITQPNAYRKWLQEKITLQALVAHAESSGLTEDPDKARRVQEGVEFALVERLYSTEVVQKVEPTPEDLQAFFEEYHDYYQHPPDLDLCVVRATAAPTFNALIEALRAGESAEELNARHASDEDVEVIARTGMQRDFPQHDGLDDLVRGVNPEVGAVTASASIDGKLTAARIEAVGDPIPMTFDEAKMHVLQHCSIDQREKRTRALLDELRDKFSASMDTSVVLRARVEPGEREHG